MDGDRLLSETYAGLAIDHDFLPKVSSLDLKFISESQDIICLIDDDFILKAYNKAWVNFARDNHGDEVLVKFPVGSKLLDAISGQLKAYITRSYQEALRANKPFEHNYECPTGKKSRIFRQSAYPIKGAAGLVVSNHLVLEEATDEDPQDFNDRFVDERGLICGCSCCRKIRDPDRLSWYWVPSLVEKPHPKTTHGICPQCLSHYYPNY